MATKPDNVNPFAQFVETPAAGTEENPFTKFARIQQLEEETKKYEEEVPFLQRITDPLKAGIARIPGYLPGLEVSSIQKQINAIREGKGGPRDPVTGESLPFQPEEAEAAIKMLQEQQAEAQKKYMAAQAEAGKYRTRPSVAAVNDAKTAREAFDLFQVDPLGVMSSVSLESIPQIVPALVLGAVTRNPTVGALAMGSTSFGGELSSGVTEYFQEKGINTKDPVEVNKALNDPKLFAEAYNHALTRASIIGPLDAASAGLASKMLVPKQVIKNQFAKEAVNIGVAQPVAQMISGGGGEALAQIATEGEITKYGQVLTEMAGEGPSSVLETAAFGGKQAYDRLRGAQPPAVTPPAAPPVTPVTPVTPEAKPKAIGLEEIEEGALAAAPTVTSAAVAPAATVTPPAPPAAAPEVVSEEATKRIAELDAEFKKIDEAYATAKPAEFAKLNERQGQIKAEIAALQSGAPVTAVTPTPTPTEEAKPKEEPPVKEGFVRVYHSGSKGEGETGRFVSTNRQYAADYRGDLPLYYTDIPANDPRVNNPDYAEQGVGQGFTFNFELTPEEATTLKEIPREAVAPTPEEMAPKATEVVTETPTDIVGLKEYSVPDYDLPTRSSAKNIPSLGRDAVLDSTNPEVIKNVSEILKDYEVESGQSVEGNYIGAVDKDIRSKEEEIKAPTISKKSVIPAAEIRVAPYDGGFLSSSSYMGKTGGYSAPTSIFGDLYKTRQEAIDAEANRIRKQAQEDKNTVALKWLDTVSKPTKESQIDINKARQAEKKAATEAKKAAAAKAKGPVDTSAVKDLIPGKIKKFQGYTIYKRQEDPDLWYVQSPDNKALNRIGQGDEVSTNLDTARSKVELYVMEEEEAGKPAVPFKSALEAKVEKITKPLAKKKEEAKEAHVEGKKSEPITSKTIEEAIDKAETKVDAKKIKQDVKNQFDQAIKRARFLTEKDWSEAKALPDVDAYVTISIPGDGKFKVKNNKERLEEFKKRLTAAIPLKEGKPKREPSAASVSAPDVAFKNLVDEGDMEAAIEYAKLQKLDLDPKADEVKLSPEQRKKIEAFFGTKEKYAEYKREIGKELVVKKEEAKPSKEKPKIADESRIVDVKAVDITPRQVRLLTNQYNKLSDADIATLEEHYGIPNYSDDFLKRIREDVVTYINKGADAVDAAIRSIIAKLQAGLLSVAVVFNPGAFQTPDFDVPRFIEETKTVTAQAPKNADMSEISNQAYSITAPAFIKAKQAFFIADKPNGKIHLFDTDGKFLKSSDALYGKQAGDVLSEQIRTMKIEDMKDVDKITPAGVYNLSVSPSPDYTGGYTLRFNDNKGDLGGIAIHAVYTGNVMEKREAKLASKDPKDKKVSFGCINVDTKFFTGNIIPRIKQMENAGVVVIPDAQERLAMFVKPTLEKVTIPAKEIKAADRAKMVARETPYYNDFTSNLDESYFDKQIVKSRDDKISDYAQARAKTRRITKEVAKYGSDIPLQKELNRMLEIEQELKDYLDATKPVRNTAEDFMARAAKELADGNISPEVEKFVRTTFEKNPGLLEGLRLSVRSRQAPGRDSANFNPYSRLITLWKDGSGIEDPKTIRHELTHSLEQMMRPETKKVLIEEWAKAFEKAMKDNTDEASKTYFDAVLDFLENPSRENFDKATRVMPSYDFYQYMNPSEYWAVNAEAMLGAKLGGAWSRFTNGLKKLLEGLKSFFGMNNKYALHKAIDELLSGEAKRINEETLTDYLFRGKYKIDFLDNIKEDMELLDKYNFPKTKRGNEASLKDRLINNYREFRNFAKSLPESPVETTKDMLNTVEQKVTLFRIKNVFFGQGLEVADVKNFVGGLRDNQKMATGSVALINAIHSGHIFAEVAALGRMVFDSGTQMFKAKKEDYSLANVVKLKNQLIKKISKQVGTDVINSYLIATRTRDIQNAYFNRDADLQEALDSGEDPEVAQRNYDLVRIAYDKIPDYMLVLDQNDKPITQTIKDGDGNVVDEIRVVNDDAVDEFLAQEKKYPELKEIMDNFTKVNHAAIDNAVAVGLYSKEKGDKLKSAEGYVPWMRSQDEIEDTYDPSPMIKSLANIPREKRFKKGFVSKDIDDIVHNMFVHTMTLTKNTVRTYAQQRIIDAYATRNEKGKIKLFNKEGPTPDGAIRISTSIAGRRRIVEFKDPLVAESVMGMEVLDIPMLDVLGMFAQGLRRGITGNPIWQTFQVLKDAPTAAAVSGIKNPFKLYFGVLSNFFAALNPNDPIVNILKSYGIGGVKGSFRTPEKELALQLNLERRALWNGILKVLDKIGDAADYAQRRAIYIRVMKESGDPLEAIIKANNVIDFLKHGSGKLALASIRTTTFMNAYAQSMNVLATAIAGGGLSAVEKKRARALFRRATYLFIGTTIIYCMLKGGDDEYDKLDDQTKLRNYIIGDVKIPMLTSYSFFFKSLVELAYYKITREGTKNEMDRKRLLTAFSDIAADALLSPNLVPTGPRPVTEILLDRNFFTGGNITPKGLKNLEVHQQWTAATSELGKLISKMSGGVLNPIEADHLMKGWFGTAASLAMAGSDLFTSDKPEKTASQNPLFGPYVLPPQPRLSESLFYPFRDEVEKKYRTYIKMQRREIKGDAKEYFEENKELIKSYTYVSQAGADLKKINAEIARISELPGSKMSPEAKRERITELQATKNRVLQGVIERRKKAGL